MSHSERVPFPDLPDSARRSLLAGARECRFADGDVLFVSGSPARGLYVVTDGVVRVTRGGGGRPHLIHEERPGGTLGEVPLFSGGEYPATASAAGPTRCLLITRDHLRAAIRRDPDVALALLARLSRRVRLLVDELDLRTARSTRERLAALLLERAGDGDEAFTLGGTQQAVAESLGTVRELVVRGLRGLRDEGVIAAAGRGRYTVRDRARLERLAAGQDTTAGGS